MASAHDFGRAVIYILHGDIEYYYDLAVSTIRSSTPMSPIRGGCTTSCSRGCRIAPTPSSHLPYGIPHAGPHGAPSGCRAAAVIYGGRFEHGQKGVFDLPEIDRALQAMPV